MEQGLAPSFPFGIDPLDRRSCCAANCATSGGWHIALVATEHVQSFAQKQADDGWLAVVADAVATASCMMDQVEEMQSHSAADVAVV